MPKCFVKKCSHSTGQKSRHPDVSLHHFPKDIKLIQEWLRLAGVEEENLDFFSTEILEDKRSDKYRMCSAHFTQDCYIMKGLRRFLKAGARPCIFPGRSLLHFSQAPPRHRIQKPSPAPVLGGGPEQAKCMCKCHINLRARMVNMSTQTEASDFLTLSLAQTNPQLVNQHQVDHDDTPTGKLSGPKQMAVHKSLALNVPPSANYHLMLTRNWEKVPEGAYKENSFMRSHLIREKAIIPNEDFPFNVVGVGSLGTVQNELKQEHGQSQDNVISEKPKFAKKLPFLDLVPNPTRHDFVTEIKQEDPIDQNGCPHVEDTKSNLKSLERPIQWRVMPSSDKKPEELEMIIGEVTSFNIVTVDESVDQIQKENHTQRLVEYTGARYGNKNSGTTNQNRDNDVCGRKKEVNRDEHNLLPAVLKIGNPSMYHKCKAEEKKAARCHDPDLLEPGNSAGEDSTMTSCKRRRIDSDTATLRGAKCSNSLPEMATSLSHKNYSKEKKYVVFESCLDGLLANMHCQQKSCTAKIKEIEKQEVGSLLVVFGTCCQGHYTKLWESQPRVNGIGAGNVLLAALLVLTGLEFAKIKELCDLIALQLFSESSYHQYRDNIFPVIDQWMQEETFLK